MVPIKTVMKYRNLSGACCNTYFVDSSLNLVGNCVNIIFSSVLAVVAKTPQLASGSSVKKKDALSQLLSCLETPKAITPSNLGVTPTPTPLSATAQELLFGADSFSPTHSEQRKQSSDLLADLKGALVTDPLLADEHGLCYDLNPAPSERSTTLIQSLLPMLSSDLNNSSVNNSTAQLTPSAPSASPMGLRVKTLEVVRDEFENLMAAKTQKLTGKFTGIKPKDEPPPPKPSNTFQVYGRTILHDKTGSNKANLTQSLTNVSGIAANDALNPYFNASLPQDSNVTGSNTNAIPGGSVTQPSITIAKSIVAGTPLQLSAKLHSVFTLGSSTSAGIPLAVTGRADTASPLFKIPTVESATTPAATNPARQVHANRKQRRKLQSFARSSAEADDDMNMENIEPVVGVGQPPIDDGRVETPPSMASSQSGKFPQTLEHSAPTAVTSSNASITPSAPLAPDSVHHRESSGRASPLGDLTANPPHGLADTAQPRDKRYSRTHQQTELAASDSTSTCPVIHMPMFPIAVQTHCSSSSFNTGVLPQRGLSINAAITTAPTSAKHTTASATHDAGASDNALFTNVPQPIEGHHTQVDHYSHTEDPTAICSTPASPHFPGPSQVFELPQLTTLNMGRAMPQTNITPTQTYLNPALPAQRKTSLPMVSGSDSAVDADGEGTALGSSDHANPLGTSSNLAFGKVHSSSSLLGGPTGGRNNTMMPTDLSASALGESKGQLDGDTLESPTVSPPFTVTSNLTADPPGSCQFATVMRTTNRNSLVEGSIPRFGSFTATSTTSAFARPNISSFVSDASLKINNLSEVINNNLNSNAGKSSKAYTGISSSFLSNFDNSKNEIRRNFSTVFAASGASSPLGRANSTSAPLGLTEGSAENDSTINKMFSPLLSSEINESVTITRISFASAPETLHPLADIVAASQAQMKKQIPFESINDSKHEIGDESVGSFSQASRSIGHRNEEENVTPPLALGDLVRSKTEVGEGIDGNQLLSQSSDSFTAPSTSLENDRNNNFSLTTNGIGNIPFVHVAHLEWKDEGRTTENSTSGNRAATSQCFSSSARNLSENALPNLRKTSRTFSGNSAASHQTGQASSLVIQPLTVPSPSPIPVTTSCEDFFELNDLDEEIRHYAENGGQYDDTRFEEVEKDYSDHPCDIARRFYDEFGREIVDPNPRDTALDCNTRYLTIKTEEVIPVGPFYVESIEAEKLRHPLACSFWEAGGASSDPSFIASPSSFHGMLPNTNSSPNPTRYNSISLKPNVTGTNNTSGTAQTSSGSVSSAGGDSTEPNGLNIVRTTLRRKIQTVDSQPGVVSDTNGTEKSKAETENTSNVSPLPPIDQPKKSVTETKRRFPKRRHYMLPPQDEQHQGLITLVLDLDETLVSAKRLNPAESAAFRNYEELQNHVNTDEGRDPNEPTSDAFADQRETNEKKNPSLLPNFDAVLEVKNELYAIYFRPQLLEFLLSAAQAFEVVLFSAGIQDYVDAIANEIQRRIDEICVTAGAAKIPVFHHRLYRHHCIKKRLYSKPVPVAQNKGGTGTAGNNLSTTGAGIIDTAQAANPTSPATSPSEAEPATDPNTPICIQPQRSYFTKRTDMLGRDMDRIVFIDNSPFAVEYCQEHTVRILDFIAEVVWSDDITGGLPYRLEMNSSDGAEELVPDDTVYHWTRDDHLDRIWETVLWPLLQPSTPRHSSSSPSPASSNMFSGSNNPSNQNNLMNLNATSTNNYETCSNVANTSLGVRLPSFSGNLHSHHYHSCTRGLSNGGLRSTSPSLGEPNNIIVQNPSVIYGSRSDQEFTSTSASLFPSATAQNNNASNLSDFKLSPNQQLQMHLGNTTTNGNNGSNGNASLRGSVDSKSGGVNFIPHPSRPRQQTTIINVLGSAVQQPAVARDQEKGGGGGSLNATSSTADTLYTRSSVTIISTEHSHRKTPHLTSTIDEPRAISPAEPAANQQLTPPQADLAAGSHLPRPILGPSLVAATAATDRATEMTNDNEGLSREPTFERDEYETVFAPYRRCELSATSILTNSANLHERAIGHRSQDSFETPLSDVHSLHSKLGQLTAQGLKNRTIYLFPSGQVSATNMNALRTPSNPSSPVTAGTSIVTLATTTNTSSTTTTTTTTTSGTTATISSSAKSLSSSGRGAVHPDLPMGGGAANGRIARRQHHNPHLPVVIDGSGSDPLSGDMSDDEKLSYQASNGKESARAQSATRVDSSLAGDGSSPSQGSPASVIITQLSQVVGTSHQAAASNSHRMSGALPAPPSLPPLSQDSAPGSFVNRRAQSSTGPNSFFTAGPMSLIGNNGVLNGSNNLTPNKQSPSSPSNGHAHPPSASSASSFRSGNENRASITASTLLSQLQRCATPSEVQQTNGHPQTHNPRGLSPINPQAFNNNSISATTTSAPTLTSRNFKSSVLKLIKKIQERDAQLWDRVLSEGV